MQPNDHVHPDQHVAPVIPINSRQREQQEKLQRVLAQRDRLAEIAAECFAHDPDRLAKATRDQLGLEFWVFEHHPHVYITKLFDWVIDDAVMLHTPANPHQQCSVCRGTTGPWSTDDPIWPGAA